LLNELKKTTETINAAEDLHKKISNLLRTLLPKTESKRLELWNELKCADEIKAGGDIKTIRNDALHFNNLLNALLEKEAGQKEEAEFLQSLLSVLEGYKGQDFTIPGPNIKIKQFISSLKESNGPFRKLLIKSEHIKECQDYLHEIGEHISKGVYHHIESVRIAKERGETAEQLVGELENEELKETKLKLERLDKKLKESKTRLIEYAIDYSKAQEIYDGLIENEGCHIYISYSESQLTTVVEGVLLELENLKRDEENCKREIQLSESEFSRLEKLGVHKYQDYLAQLEHLYTPIQNLEKTIAVTFNKLIGDMIDSKVKSVSDQEELYFEEIQKFLASKIGSIRHINSSYKLKKVDVISKEISTTSGKKIKFTDLGTGQSQGAYIEGLLNSNDNKRIIALFDEVAMMDSNTLKPIFKKLQKMYDSNKLIAAIIVQKGDDTILVKSLSDL
jgi:DNA repair protein SbcC/Rad50